MAKLSPKPYPGDWEFDASDWEAQFKKQEAQLDAIDAAQPSPGSPSLVGARLDFPRGDGYATYVVVKDKPLTVAHVPHGAAWQTDECTLRGVNANYVRWSLARAASWRELFGKKTKETR
jgi:hypothetical protein